MTALEMEELYASGVAQRRESGFGVSLRDQYAVFKSGTPARGSAEPDYVAQHHWLSQRAIQLQDITIMTPEDPQKRERRLALFMRYQTTNERAFHKCLNDLLKLRAEKRKAEIGFESQERRQAEEARRQNNENRKQDVHKFKVWLAEGQAEHQQLLNARLETPEMRVPGRLERIKSYLQAA